MSSKIPVEKESAKRRRVEEERTSESEREASGGRSHSASSCGSSRSRLDCAAATSDCKKITEVAYKNWEEHNKETGDLFNNTEEVFKERVKRTTAKEWDAACRSLGTLAALDAVTLWEMAALEELSGPGVGKKVRYMVSLATDQQERFDWALREYAHRYRGAVKEWNRFAKEKVERTVKEEDWEERIMRLTEEKREVEIERDRLRAILSTREEASGGEGTAPPPRDSGPEMMELGEEVSSPSSGDVAIPAALLGALEKWLERKWEQLASRWIPSPIGEERKEPGDEGPGPWAKVVGRKAEKKPPPDGTTGPIPGGKRGAPVRPPPTVRSGDGRTEPSAAAPPSSVRTERKERRWPALPGSAVVAISPIPGGTQAGVELMMREAQQGLSLDGIGVPPLEVKRSKLGGYLLGVRGQGAEAAADRLAEGLRGLSGASGVRVSRPARTRDIRVSGLSAGITPEEVAYSVAAAGGCPTEDIRPGTVRCSPFGMGTLWLRCPIATAVKVARARGVRVGWIWAPVELLEPRPDRCFRCLELGHLKLQCASSTDRSARCYRCGGTGHAAAGCREVVPRCPLCGDDESRNGRHVLGGPGCVVTPPQRQPAAAKTAAKVTPTGVT